MIEIIIAFHGRPARHSLVQKAKEEDEEDGDAQATIRKPFRYLCTLMILALYDEILYGVFTDDLRRARQNSYLDIKSKRTYYYQN